MTHCKAFIYRISSFPSWVFRETDLEGLCGLMGMSERVALGHVAKTGARRVQDVIKLHVDMGEFDTSAIAGNHVLHGFILVHSCTILLISFCEREILFLGSYSRERITLEYTRKG